MALHQSQLLTFSLTPTLAEAPEPAEFSIAANVAEDLPKIIDAIFDPGAYPGDGDWMVRITSTDERLACSRTTKLSNGSMEIVLQELRQLVDLAIAEP